MQRIIAAFIFASIALQAVADENAVTPKNLKSFKLDVGEQAILNEKVPPDLCCTNNQFDVGEPAAGADSLKVSPEFRYYKQDDDYNNRLDQYDTEVKVKVKVPVDLDF